MAKIQLRDYYFGAALSMFFKHNKDSRPSMIESSKNNSQLYKMTTDTSEDFFIYMKYTEQEAPSQNPEYHVWQFPLSEKDKSIIDNCIVSGLKTYLILICGQDSLNGGTIAILTQDEYSRITHKTCIRIRTQGQKPKKFYIVDRKSTNTFSIDINRIEKRITDIK